MNCRSGAWFHMKMLSYQYTVQCCCNMVRILKNTHNKHPIAHPQGWAVSSFVSLKCDLHISIVSCLKGPTRHAYSWQIGPFWQDTLDLCHISQTMWPVWHWPARQRRVEGLCSVLPGAANPNGHGQHPNLKMDMGQVTKVQLSFYLVLLSTDSKTK